MNNDIKIERNKHLEICIINESGIYLSSKTVESNILFEILKKLEEIRCGLIDIENIKTKKEN